MGRCGTIWDVSLEVFGLWNQKNFASDSHYGGIGGDDLADGLPVRRGTCLSAVRLLRERPARHGSVCDPDRAGLRASRIPGRRTGPRGGQRRWPSRREVLRHARVGGQAPAGRCSRMAALACPSAAMRLSRARARGSARVKQEAVSRRFRTVAWAGTGRPRGPDRCLPRPSPPMGVRTAANGLHRLVIGWGLTRPAAKGLRSSRPS